MSRRFHLCIFSLLAAAAFAVLPFVLHARGVSRGPLNGVSLGGMNAGSVTNLPFAAQTPDEVYAELLAAIRRGAPSLLERLLSNYAHTPRFLDTRLNYMDTPLLFHAISELKLEHTELLITYGSIVNYQLPDTQFRKFQKVAARSIDPKQTIKGSCTPLAYLCFLPAPTGSQRRDSLALAKLLVACGADCNLPGFEDKMPVQILCETDRMDILKFLLSTKQVEFKSDVLEEYMRTHKDDEGVKLLSAYRLEREAEKLKNADAARKAKKPGFTGKPTLTFNAAVITDNSSEIKKHLGVMKDVDDPLDEEDNTYHQTPLIRAVELGKPVAVRLILDSGADPNHPDDTTCTPLVYANMKELDEIGTLLKAYGAVLPVCADIVTAAKQDRPDEIERIFKDATARKLKTATMLSQGLVAALQLEREKAFAKLIQLGANPNQIKVKNQIPLVFHLIDRNLDAFLIDCKAASTPVDLKVRHPLVKLPPMLYAASGTKTTPDVIRALVKLGGSPNSYGPNHKTALMYAAESGNEAVVDALLKAGADPKATDSDGKTYQDYVK